MAPVGVPVSLSVPPGTGLSGLRIGLQALGLMPPALTGNFTACREAVIFH